MIQRITFAPPALQRLTSDDFHQVLLIRKNSAECKKQVVNSRPHSCHCRVLDSWRLGASSKIGAGLCVPLSSRWTVLSLTVNSFSDFAQLSMEAIVSDDRFVAWNPEECLGARHYISPWFIVTSFPDFSTFSHIYFMVVCNAILSRQWQGLR